MNPLRNFFLFLSKVPPAVILLVIIGLAVLVTMMVTGTISAETQEAIRLSRSGEVTTSENTTSGAQKQVVVATIYIPAGTKIDSKFVRAAKVPELNAWDDAFSSTETLVGRISRRAIPAGNQIREIDVD